MSKNWENKKGRFDCVDVRKLTGNFLPALLSKAEHVKVGGGICVIQSFEPIPLYSAMADLGFEHHTERISDGEYRVYFYWKRGLSDFRYFLACPRLLVALPLASAQFDIRRRRYLSSPMMG